MVLNVILAASSKLENEDSSHKKTGQKLYIFPSPNLKQLNCKEIHIMSHYEF